MNPNLFIRFKGIEQEFDSQVSLADFGASLTGFHVLLTQFNDVLGLSIEPEIQVTALRDGSVVVDSVLWFRGALDCLPFDSVADFIEFLKLAEEPLANEVESFFLTLGSDHRTINDWAASNPVSYDVVRAGFVFLLVKAHVHLFKKAGQFKKGEVPEEKSISRKKQRKLHKIVKKRGFKRALAPLADDKACSIEISSNREFNVAAKIDHQNMESYLAEDDTVLSHLEDGMTYELVGTVTSLKATRGDRVTLQISHDGELYNLDALPAPGQTSKSYRDYYTEDVKVIAEVRRTSLYRKPQLRVCEIELLQPELSLEYKDDDHSKLVRGN